MRALEVATSAQSALSEQGEGFVVTSTYGCAGIPADAPDAANALRIADSRLYAHKDSRQRSSAGTQTSAALLQALQEREPDLRDHLDEVAQLSVRIGYEMGLSGQELEDLARRPTFTTSGRWLCRTPSCSSRAAWTRSSGS